MFDKFGMSVSRVDAIGLMYERYKLKQFFKAFNVDCVFDVGANRGQFVALLASIGFAGPIVSFEPIPELADDLRRRAQSSPNWKIEQIALDETEREIDFHVMALTEFSSIRSPKKLDDGLHSEQNLAKQSIQMVTGVLSRYIDKYQSLLGFRRPFLKLDTQGNDVAVAAGAGAKLKTFAGIQSELSVRPIYHDQPSYREALEFFAANGFEISAFLPNHDVFPRVVEVDCILLNSMMLSR